MTIELKPDIGDGRRFAITGWNNQELAAIDAATSNGRLPSPQRSQDHTDKGRISGRTYFFWLDEEGASIALARSWLAGRQWVERSFDSPVPPSAEMIRSRAAQIEKAAQTLAADRARAERRAAADHQATAPEPEAELEAELELEPEPQELETELEKEPEDERVV